MLLSPTSVTNCHTFPDPSPRPRRTLWTTFIRTACHNPDHVLSHLLPPKKESVHALRPRVHDIHVVLSEADDRMRRTFLTRMLYSDYFKVKVKSKFPYSNKNTVCT